MSRKSILEAKQKAKETNELLEYLTDLIEKNDKNTENQLTYKRGNIC